MSVVDCLFHEGPPRIRRALAHLYRRMVPLPLSSDQADFITRNAAFWQDHSKKKRTGKQSRYALVPVDGPPVMYLCDASLAAIVAEAKDLNLLFIDDCPRKSVKRRVLASFPDATFVDLGIWRRLLMELEAVVSAVRAYRSINNPRELLEFRVDEIRFGDVIYDAVLAHGYATINAIDLRTLQKLQSFYFLRSVILAIIKEHEIATAVFAHTIGLRGAVFSRYLLRYRIEVLNRVGSHQILVKKYKNLSDIGFYPVKPEARYFDIMMESEDGRLSRIAEEYLERRFRQQVAEIAVNIAFNRARRVFADRQGFCAEYRLDPRKPIVFVMLHAFNDFPHSHFAKPMIFQDYYHWFLATLEIARTVKCVNWIFKEHPAASYYRTRDLDLRSVFERIKDDHIRFLPSKADFNAISIRHLATAIVTCIGTAGLEYATQGIPCILGGESGYSGFGFTIEPGHVAEYEICLRSVDQLRPLTVEQMRAAKMVAYFYFCVMESAVYHFCPRLDSVETDEWGTIVPNRKFWKAAADQFNDRSAVERMRRQVEALGRFISDESWTQYVDLSQFSFFSNDVVGQAVKVGQERQLDS